MNKAKAYFAWLLEKLGYRDKFKAIEPEMIKLFGANWRKEKASIWSISSELVEKYGGKDERCCYAFFSHFTHSSVVASYFLENTAPTISSLDTAIAIVYGGYVLATKDFLDFIWGPIVTTESDGCKNDFLNIMRKWI